jgi:hypothetical protein
MNRLELIQTTLKQLKQLKYNDYICLLKLYEEVQHISDIDNILVEDLEEVDNWIYNNVCMDQDEMSLFSEEFKELRGFDNE